LSPGTAGHGHLIANYIRSRRPAGGPNFYEFGRRRVYEIHVTQRSTVSRISPYQFRSRRKKKLREASSTTPADRSLSDPKWNRKQFYRSPGWTGRRHFLPTS